MSDTKIEATNAMVEAAMDAFRWNAPRHPFDADDVAMRAALTAALALVTPTTGFRAGAEWAAGILTDLECGACRANEEAKTAIRTALAALPEGGDGKTIKVWSFYDAPKELRDISQHGGDEDWLAVVPAGVEIPTWMDSGSQFGCCAVSQHHWYDGSTVCIGAHA